MSNFTQEQLGQVIKNEEGQVIINPEVFTELVQIGYKRKELADHYEMSEAAIGRVLDALQLKIRKFKKEEFIIPGINDGGFNRENTAQIVKQVFTQKEDGTLTPFQVVETVETIEEVTEVQEEAPMEAPAVEEVQEEVINNPFAVEEENLTEEDEVAEEEVAEEEVTATPVPEQRSPARGPWSN